MYDANTPIMDEVKVKRKDTCLQIAGQDEVLREYTLGGPTCGRNIQMILDIPTLELLLEVAKASVDTKATIFGAGITIKVRRDNRGNIYETLHIVGHQPKARRPGVSLSLPSGPAQSLVNGWKKRW